MNRDREGMQVRLIDEQKGRGLDATRASKKKNFSYFIEENDSSKRIKNSDWRLEKTKPYFVKCSKNKVFNIQKKSISTYIYKNRRGSLYINASDEDAGLARFMNDNIYLKKLPPNPTGTRSWRFSSRKNSKAVRFKKYIFFSSWPASRQACCPVRYSQGRRSCIQL